MTINKKFILSFIILILGLIFLIFYIRAIKDYTIYTEKGSSYYYEDKCWIETKTLKGFRELYKTEFPCRLSYEEFQNCIKQP